MDEQRFEQAMRELGGPPVDPYDALEAVRPLLVGAHRRRAATRASWLAAVAALFIGTGVAVAVGHGANRDRVKVETTDGDHVTTPVTTGASSIIVTAPAVATTAAAIGPTDSSTSVTVQTTPPSEAPTDPPPVATTTPAHPTATAPHQTTPPTVAPTTAPSHATGRFRYETVNGHIDVQVGTDSLVLVAYEALNGATSELKDNGPTRIEVRFHLGGTDSSIRVTLEGGVLTIERKP
jgi:cytoskeletal protein RodZ